MSLQDSLFLEEVESDVQLFAAKETRKRVLVFPPVNNYRRFLIHQLVQDQFDHLLYTFSIGQGWCRRTVVCYKSDVIRDPKLNGALSGTCEQSNSACAMGVEEPRSAIASPENSRQRSVKSVPSIGIYRPPAARKARCDNTDNAGDTQQDQPSQDPGLPNKARQKRPDRAVYVPRHRRSNDPEGTSLPRESSKTNRSTRARRRTTSPARQNSSEIESVLDSRQRRESETETRDGNSSSSSPPTEENPQNVVEHRISPQEIISIYDSSGSLTEIGEKIGDDSNNSILVEEGPRREENTVLDNGSVTNGEDTKSSRSCEEDKFDSICDRLRPVQDESSDSNSQFVEVRLSSNDTRASDIIDTHESNQSARSSKDIVEIGEESEHVDDMSLTSSESNGHVPEVIMSVNSRKKDESKEEDLLNCDEIVNRKNRRIVRQNLVSDVLRISEDRINDETPKNETPVHHPVPKLSPTPASTPEKKVKKVERAKSKPAPPPSPPIKINRDECDWESLFDDNGDCLEPTLIEELTAAVGEVSIEKPKNDYRPYSKAPIEISNDEFAHVLEIYNFPSDFKTSDLAAVFSPFKNGGFELKWVDDTHCLGVFSSPLIAAEVLASDHSFVKTRPLSEATTLSKTKARRSAEFLQPYRTRPPTCPAMARRLVTGALGVKLPTARQEREREKIVLREAKERRRMANKQRDNAWEGIIAEK